jgi:hypothetical protein
VTALLPALNPTAAVENKANGFIANGNGDTSGRMQRIFETMTESFIFEKRKKKQL